MRPTRPSGPSVTDWLLDSDPALRWQVERDLLGAEESVWRATRARVGTEGFGAALLAHQDDDGQWAGGAFFPADVRDGSSPEEPGQPWTATTWSLDTLREWGLDPAVVRARDTVAKLRANSRWEYDDLSYWGGEVDCCINAKLLSIGTWLGVDMEANAQWFADVQLDDGGWNCEWVHGAQVGSVHSTANSLAALLDVELAGGGTEATRAARGAGEEYLLQRRLMYRRTTGEPIGDFVTRLAYPWRWRYSILRALDHFRRADALAEESGSESSWRGEARLEPAISALRALQRPDGTWHQDAPMPGREWFGVDGPDGTPSKWLTLQALRVLRWWDGGGATPGVGTRS